MKKVVSHLKKNVFYKNDKLYSRIFRWWSIACVYFFIGWGTSVGQTSLIDMILILGIAIGVFETLITNPVISILFYVKPKERTIFSLLLKMVDSIVTVSLVVVVYESMNTLLHSMFTLQEGSVPFAGEPITFAIIYLLINSALKWFIGLAAQLHKDAKEAL